MCILARKQHLSPVPHKKQSPSPVASTDRFWPPSLPLSCGDLLLPNQDPSNSHSNSRDSWSWNGTELVSLRQNGKLVHSSRWKKLLRGPPILRSTCTSQKNIVLYNSSGKINGGQQPTFRRLFSGVLVVIDEVDAVNTQKLTRVLRLSLIMMTGHSLSESTASICLHQCT